MTIKVRLERLEGRIDKRLIIAVEDPNRPGVYRVDGQDYTKPQVMAMDGPGVRLTVISFIGPA